MKAVLKILFLAVLLTLSTFANTHLNILKDLDIDKSFMQTSYYQQIKQGINERQIADFTRTLKNGYKHIYSIKDTIKISGLPEAFLYLPMIESGFANHAVSGVKATGVWQFMDVTAKNYGLKIDKYIDERRDIVKSTKAATSYLKGLKSQFGKWYLALMAYNCGEGRLNKAITQAGTDDLATLLDPTKGYLPSETRNFIIKILKASMISKDPNFALSKDATLLNQPVLATSKVSVPGGTSLKQISDSIGVSVKRLKDDNTHLKFAFTPPNIKSYHVYIPQNKKDMFAKNFKPVVANNRFYSYTVKSGDTLFAIAKKSGVSHKAIKEYNELKNSLVSVDQKLIIPRSDQNKFQSYVVQNGDTLEILSKKFNVKVKDIKDANSLASNDNLQVGVKIVIP